MMRYISIFILLVSLISTDSLALCYNNTESVLDSQKEKTKKMINKKKKEIIITIGKYEEALKEKRKKMIELWKLTTEVEFLMKENQQLRKRIIKHWKETKALHPIAGLH